MILRFCDTYREQICWVGRDRFPAPLHTRIWISEQLSESEQQKESKQHRRGWDNLPYDASKSCTQQGSASVKEWGIQFSSCGAHSCPCQCRAEQGPWLGTGCLPWPALGTITLLLPAPLHRGVPESNCRHLPQSTRQDFASVKQWLRFSPHPFFETQSHSPSLFIQKCYQYMLGFREGIIPQLNDLFPIKTGVGA